MLHVQIKDWAIDKWHAAVISSASEAIVDGVRMPGLPPPEVQTRIVGSAGEKPLAEASVFIRALLDRSRRMGAPVGRDSRVLDFGCGWGRMTRFLAREVPDDRLFGVDPSPDMIELCRQTEAVGVFEQIPYKGVLPFEDGFFTHVYAYSVFTHLPRNMAQHWLAELVRVCAPGAAFCLTVEPVRFLDFIAAPPAEPANAWHKMLHDQFGGMARQIRPQVEREGYAFLPTNGAEIAEYYGDAIYTRDFIARNWAGFELIEYLDDPQQFWQAFVAMRKRSA